MEISKMATAYGTELLVVKENRDETDYVDFYTIYKGYEIEMVLTHVEPAEPGEEAVFAPVTDEEIQLVWLLSGTRIFVRKRFRGYCNLPAKQPL